MHNYSCSTCGAQLYWDPQKQSLYCKFCDSEFSPDDFVDKTAFTEDGQAPQVAPPQISDTVIDLDTEDMVVYECSTCGGEVVAQKTTMATVCPYCGEAVSVTSKSIGDFRPELVIPFAQDKKGAIELFKKYVQRSFLVPKSFKEDNIIDKIQGIFIPFYLHTITDAAQHDFKGETTSCSRVGNDRVTTHKVYNLHIDATGKFDRLPTDAAKGIENELMDALEPFSYDKLKEYNPAYMAGFVAEQRDEEIESLKTRAKERCKKGMRANAREAFSGYKELTMLREENIFGTHNCQYVMLPVWILNVKHNGKKYRFAINGQTGKAVGKLPLNYGKLAGVCAGVFAVSEVLAAIALKFFM